MSTNLLDKISEDEYKMLTNYRDWYAWNEEHKADCVTVPVKDILAECWAIEKDTLFKLLGGNLIISKDFVYEKSIDELISELNEMVDGRGRFGRSEREGWRFPRDFYDWYRDQYPIPIAYWDYKLCKYRYESEAEAELANKNSVIRDGLCELISNCSLAKNKYEGTSFTIELKDGKEYTIRTGCKPMKALAKIAEAYDLKHFEDFRICHSLIHNQKKVAGKVCLSIHPLDYWTMSDNDCDWESCMNWRDNGGYRQGTVEMMNSPCVVVAYITAKNGMKIGDLSWNSKKWRQLFIVDPQCILGIKSYPYYNDNLTLSVTTWLKDLAETNLGWEYFGDADGNPIKYDFSPLHNPEHMDDKYSIKFSFYSNKMYTDVGSLEWHPLYVGTQVHENGKWKGYKIMSGGTTPIIQIDFNYSGFSQCMSCGDINPRLESECCLVCESCQTTYHCEECGEYCGEDYYWVDDTRLCEDCYDQHTDECMVCGERHFIDNMDEIFLRLPVSQEYIDKHFHNRPITQKYINNHLCNNTVGIFLRFPLPICRDSYCQEEFKKEFLLKGAEIKQLEFAAEHTINKYVDMSDLNLNNYHWDGYLPWQFADGLEIAQKTGNYDSLAEDFVYHLINKAINEPVSD